MTERYTDDVTATELHEGDQISHKLVAPNAKMLGDPIRSLPESEEDIPDTRLVKVTQTNRMDNTHTAILYDPDAELFVRAGHIDKSEAWTQAEADWTVKEVGKDVTVEEVDELERPEDEQDTSDMKYAQTWVEILFDEIRYEGGDRELHDELALSGTSLSMQDYDGRKAVAEINVE